MRRSAVSIPSNIAEGDQRETDKEAIRYFYIAKGSTAELNTQVIIAHEIGYLDSTTYTEIQNSCAELIGMLAKLIAARAKSYRKVEG